MDRPSVTGRAPIPPSATFNEVKGVFPAPESDNVQSAPALSRENFARQSLFQTAKHEIRQSLSDDMARGHGAWALGTHHKARLSGNRDRIERGLVVRNFWRQQRADAKGRISRAIVQRTVDPAFNRRRRSRQVNRD